MTDKQPEKTLRTIDAIREDFREIYASGMTNAEKAVKLQILKGECQDHHILAVKASLKRQIIFGIGILSGVALAAAAILLPPYLPALAAIAVAGAKAGTIGAVFSFCAMAVSMYIGPIENERVKKLEAQISNNLQKLSTADGDKVERPFMLKLKLAANFNAKPEATLAAAPPVEAVPPKLQ